MIITTIIYHLCIQQQIFIQYGQIIGYDTTPKELHELIHGPTATPTTLSVINDTPKKDGSNPFPLADGGLYFGTSLSNNVFDESFMEELAMLAESEKFAKKAFAQRIAKYFAPLQLSTNDVLAMGTEIDMYGFAVKNISYLRNLLMEEQAKIEERERPQKEYNKVVDDINEIIRIRAILNDANVIMNEKTQEFKNFKKRFKSQSKSLTVDEMIYTLDVKYNKLVDEYNRIQTTYQITLPQISKVVVKRVKKATNDDENIRKKKVDLI